MADIETLQSELRIQSVEHSYKIAAARKQIQSLLNYELPIIIAMLENDEPSERVLPFTKDIVKKLLAVKQFGGTSNDPN